MKNHILKIKWLALLFLSSSVLIWRLIDFADEAANNGFHMTRCGFAMKGSDAEALQLFLILGGIVWTWKVIKNLYVYR